MHRAIRPGISDKKSFFQTTNRKHTNKNKNSLKRDDYIKKKSKSIATVSGSNEYRESVYSEETHI